MAQYYFGYFKTIFLGILCFLIGGFSLLGQNRPLLKGRVIADTANHLQVTIINMTAETGVVSKPDGTFVIAAQKDDTLFFTAVGYRPHRLKVTKNVLAQNKLEIDLQKKVYMLHEVQVNSTPLTGDLKKGCAKYQLL